jgi:hypothetical protein
MTSFFWINFPLAFLFAAIVTGIPMWLIIRHPDKAPDHSGAHAYLRVKAELEQGATAGPAQVAAMAAAAVPPIPRKGRWKLGPPRGIAPRRRPALTAKAGQPSDAHANRAHSDA